MLNYDLFLCVVTFLCRDALVKCLTVCKNSMPLVQRTLTESVEICVVPIRDLMHVYETSKWIMKQATSRKIPIVLVLREQFISIRNTSQHLSLFVQSMSGKVHIMDIVEVPYKCGKSGIFVKRKPSSKGYFMKTEEVNTIVTAGCTCRPFYGWNKRVNEKWSRRPVNKRLRPIIPTFDLN